MQRWKIAPSKFSGCSAILVFIYLNGSIYSGAHLNKEMMRRTAAIASLFCVCGIKVDPRRD